jgi:hypothetical protein
MPLPEDFQFSQASLQDFVDCQRRFQLRYLMELAWPAAEAEPIEEHERRMQLGQDFHKMVQQHVLGLDAALIERTAADPDLSRWWHNYIVYRPVALFGGDAEGADIRSELSLVGRLHRYRLVAKYDLLIVKPEATAVILDWKTSRRHTPARTLLERLQTGVYRYLLAAAGAYLNGGRAFAPEAIEMVYWYPEFPESPVRLPYDASQCADDAHNLRSLIERIARLGEEDFDLTDDVRRCTYCPYRSYCDRGVKAGPIEDAAVSWEPSAPDDVELDFEQIAEIEF